MNEKLESLLENISFSYIENRAVDGLFAGIKEELEANGIEYDSPMYSEAFDYINSEFNVSRS